LPPTFFTRGRFVDAFPLLRPRICGRNIHGDEAALAAARLRGAHRYRAVLIDLNHVPSEAAAAMDSPPEGLSGLGDDRVGVGTSLNREALGNFPLQEGVERVFSSPEGIDFSVYRHV
jgi:hypothetical protein